MSNPVPPEHPGFRILRSHGVGVVDHALGGGADDGEGKQKLMRHQEQEVRLECIRLRICHNLQFLSVPCRMCLGLIPQVRLPRPGIS